MTMGGFRQCTDGQYYDGQVGRCRRCKTCRAGYEFDETVKLNISSQYGYMACPSCKLCQDGSYREANSNVPSCSRCVLNCALLYRYQVKECGGTRKGGCGGCMLGYTAMSADINSFCEPMTTTKTIENNTFSSQPGYSPKLGGSYDHITPTYVLMPAIGSVLFLVIVLFVLWLIKCSRQNRNRNDEESNSNRREKKKSPRYLPKDLATAGSSKADLLSNSNSSNLGSDNDIDTDGGKNMQSKQRGEMRQSLTEFLDQPNCIHPSISGMTISHIPVGRTIADYPKHRVFKNDKCLVTVARNICTERVNEVFRYLKMEPPQVEPERELWIIGKHDYASFILQVLIKWVEQEGSNATFDKLCLALEMADFNEVIRFLEVNPQQNSTLGGDKESTAIACDYRQSSEM